MRRATYISVISYADCLGLSQIISAKIHAKCALQPKIANNSSAVLVMIGNKSVSICNPSCARLADSSRNRTFSRGYPNSMRSYGGLLEPT